MTLKVYHILVCHAVRTDKEERGEMRKMAFLACAAAGVATAMSASAATVSVSGFKGTVYAPGCVQLCCCSWAARGLRGGGGTCYNVRRAETRTIYHERNN